jgi:hypothetical protein
MLLPSPLVQYAALVQVGGPEKAGSVPASMPQLPAGIPELTHAEKALCFEAATAAAGGGGIGAVVLAIRCTQDCPLVTAALLGEEARSWASEVRAIGAPPIGGLPWQLVHEPVSTSATSQGRSPATPASEGPASTPPSPTGGGPASTGGMQLPAGMLLETHAENSLTAAAGTAAYGAGGIGDVMLVIRATDRWPSVCPG